MPIFQYRKNDQLSKVEYTYDRSAGTLTAGEVIYACDGRSVTVDGRRIPFWVLSGQDSVSVWLDGVVYSFAVEDPRRRTKSGPTCSGGGLVKAEMPGKILQVAVNSG